MTNTLFALFCFQRVLELHWNTDREQIEHLLAPVTAPQAIRNQDLLLCPGTKMKAHRDAVQ
jgi:hypothetical protein